MQQNEQQSAESGTDVSNWERELLTRLAMSTLNEQRRTRRWRTFFILLGFIYFGIVLILLTDSDWDGASKGPHTAIVDVTGVIAPETPANAEFIIAGLNDAFENEDTSGVILRINSPGGSPVQAGQIYDEVVRLRNRYPDIPLYAVIEDVGASGGYYIAAAAEKIYADKASIVGSIGVRMDSFGFVDAMKKLGVERRLMTAGENKAPLDPFLPESKQDKEHIQILLNTIHQQFIQAVKSQRGDRLVGSNEVFSGLFWTGEKSVALGLVDELGDIHYVAREVIGQEKLRDFTRHEDFFTRFVEQGRVSLLNSLQGRMQFRLY
ncbi:MAG TPA: S49 family peptidase [Gammaproteobacteria bacterium]